MRAWRGADTLRSRGSVPPPSAGGSGTRIPLPPMSVVGFVHRDDHFTLLRGVLIAELHSFAAAQPVDGVGVLVARVAATCQFEIDNAADGSSPIASQYCRPSVFVADFGGHKTASVLRPCLSTDRRSASHVFAIRQ